MTEGAERRISAVYPEEFPVGIIVGIVTGGTMYFAVSVEKKARRRCGRQLRVGQRIVIGEGNGMIVGEVSAEVRQPR